MSIFYIFDEAKKLENVMKNEVFLENIQCNKIKAIYAKFLKVNI